jgi:DNA replication protein DnaC
MAYFQAQIGIRHPHLGDPTLADAICDRILHNAHRIALKGPSRRKEAEPKN